MEKIPDRLNIEKEDKKYYDNLVMEVFSSKERKEQFLFAMAIGFKNGISRPLNSKEGFFRTEYLSPEDKALLNSLAIYQTGSAEVLQDLDTVYRIAEEYAHAGIKIIYDEATSGQPGSIFKKYELTLSELFDSLTFE